MGKSDVTLRIGDKYNPEKRCGRPRWTGGRSGQGERLLETWFTYATFKSYADNDLLKRLKDDGEISKNRKYVLVERVRNVYYASGTFYRLKANRNPERDGRYATFEPITGSIWTCFPRYQARYGLPDAEILLFDGIPHTIRMGGDAFTVTNESWPVMESFLGLDESYKRKGASHDAA